MHTSDLCTLETIPCDTFSLHLIELLPTGSALRNEQTKNLLDVTFICGMLCIIIYLSQNPEITRISNFSSQRKKTTVPDKLQYSAKINQYAHDNPLSLDSNKKVRHTETYSSLSKGITAFPDHHLTFLLTNPSANPSACEAATDNTVSAVKALPNNCDVHSGFL